MSTRRTEDEEETPTPTVRFRARPGVSREDTDREWMIASSSSSSSSAKKKTLFGKSRGVHGKDNKDKEEHHQEPRRKEEEEEDEDDEWDDDENDGVVSFREIAKRRKDPCTSRKMETNFDFSKIVYRTSANEGKFSTSFETADKIIIIIIGRRRRRRRRRSNTNVR